MRCGQVVQVEAASRVEAGVIRDREQVEAAPLELCGQEATQAKDSKVKTMGVAQAGRLEYRHYC